MKEDKMKQMSPKELKEKIKTNKILAWLFVIVIMVQLIAVFYPDGQENRWTENILPFIWMPICFKLFMEAKSLTAELESS